MIAQLGGFLKPIEDPTRKLSYDTYSAPQRAAFDQWKNLYNSQYNYETLNPWIRSQNNQGALNNSWMMGNAKRVYNSGLSRIERNRNDQLASAQSTYEDLMRNNYNQQIKNMGMSNTGMTTI